MLVRIDLDVAGEGYEGSFAFLNTIDDMFLVFDGMSVFDSREELEAVLAFCDVEDNFAERLLRLAPAPKETKA